jgi:predicted RNA-binding Zn ribbon-like protein
MDVKPKTVRPMVNGDRWLLADPQLALGLVGTLRPGGDALAGELPDDHEAVAWLREHADADDAHVRAGLTDLRGLLRSVFTAIVDGAAPAPHAIATINDLAARAPVNLAAHQADDETIVVERTSLGAPDMVLHAEIARSALTLLAEPARTRLRLCRAPGCVLFFLTEHPRQRWCSASCGNRARVARHYDRRRSG